MTEIFLNQAGYLPRSKKTAVIPFPWGEFSVCNEGGNTVYSGKTEHFGADLFSGDDVYTADFSSLEREGRYRVVCGDKTSEWFRIDSSIMKDSLDMLTKAFYFLRCGSGLEEKYAGAYAHSPCHCGKALVWDDHSKSAEACGGWHDAGDYGRYVTAGACALSHMLYAYTLYPRVFAEQCLNIPESGGRTPDILAECRYELEWLLKMQREDGAVYHKLTTAHHAPFVMPEEDKAQLYLLPVSSMAVADFAAVCALAFRVYKDLDGSFADRLLAAAERAYSWLEEHPEFVGFDNPEGCTTGGYGEWSDRDNRFWAAAELYAATGGESYHAAVIESLDNDFPLTALGYGSVGGFGAMAYLFGVKNGADELKKRFSDLFIAEAEKLAGLADSCGYGVAMDEYHYCWGSNMNLMKNGMVFAIADVLAGTDRFRSYAQAQADVLLGKNALGISYVTGIGGYRCNNPHLRPSAADGIDECIPGMVCGGPNRTPNDPHAKELIPEGTPPMKCFADVVECYSLNEITIYWNSPAVFLFAYLAG